jgi:hypothetical protein
MVVDSSLMKCFFMINSFCDDFFPKIIELFKVLIESLIQILFCVKTPKNLFSFSLQMMDELNS